MAALVTEVYYNRDDPKKDLFVTYKKDCHVEFTDGVPEVPSCLLEDIEKAALVKGADDLMIHPIV